MIRSSTHNRTIRRVLACRSARLAGWACPTVLGVVMLLVSSASWSTEETGEVVGIPQLTPLEGPLVLQARALRGLRTDVLGEMFSSEEGGDLSFSVLAAPLPGADGSSTVPLFVEIDGASFLQFNQSDLARLEIYVYAVTADQEIADYLAEAFAVDVEGLGERIWQSGLEFFGRLELPPGSYELRILVRNFQSRSRGLKVSELEVPEFSETGALALMPLIPEPADRDVWIPVRSWRTAGEAINAAYPLLRLGQNLNPAAQPVLIVGRESEIYVPVSGLPAGPLEGTLQIEAEGESGFAVIGEAAVRVEGRAPTSIDGMDIVSVRAAPPIVEPGSYRARLSLSTKAGPRVEATPIEVLIVGKETRERNLLWSDMRWLLGSAPRVAQVEVEKAPTDKKQDTQNLARARKELTDRYEAIVLQLADMSQETVRGLLFEFESEALGGAGGQRLEHLHEAELEVATRIAQHHRDMVMPLVILHEQMYERYRNRRLYTLLHHTRSFLEELADVYIKAGGGSRTGARMLASLGGYLQEANLSGGSRRLFDRALALDYECSAALFGLASSLEKYGDYQSAIDRLEQLLLVDTDFDEGKLRLALNLERVGQRRRARDLLESIVAGEPVGWVGGVAYQELGRVLLQTGDVQAAADLLEMAVERLPQQSATLFLLGHAYDRLGRTRTGLERLAEIKPERRSRRSERWFYDRWPQSQLTKARSALAELAEGAKGDLAVALAAEEPEGKKSRR